MKDPFDYTPELFCEGETYCDYAPDGYIPDYIPDPKPETLVHPKRDGYTLTHS